jgi:hypothetical protein
MCVPISRRRTLLAAYSQEHRCLLIAQSLGGLERNGGIRPGSLINRARSHTAMAHLIDRHLIERANAAVLLSMVWAALAACVIGAVETVQDRPESWVLMSWRRTPHHQPRLPHRACREPIPRTVRYHAPIRSPKSVPDTVFPIARVPSSHSPSRAYRGFSRRAGAAESARETGLNL